jgi:hypothetical protein
VGGLTDLLSLYRLFYSSRQGRGGWARRLLGVGRKRSAPKLRLDQLIIASLISPAEVGCRFRNAGACMKWRCLVTRSATYSSGQ